MRMLRSFSAAISMAALVIVFQASSQTTEPAKPINPEQKVDMKAKPKTARALLEDMAAQFDLIDQMIKGNKLAMVHEHAETIGNACKVLKTVDVPADPAKRSKVEGYLASMEQIAIILDEYGDANNATALGIENKKGRALYDILVKQYPQASNQKSAQPQSSNISLDYWTCPMHQEIHKAAPGNCPKCEMKLVLKKSHKNITTMTSADQSKIDMNSTNVADDTIVKASNAGFWTCTMHPEVHKPTSGQCPICSMNLVLKKDGKIPQK